jgi:nitrogen regulatory protein P-II 1
MKELDIIIPHERLNEVNDILHKHKVGGMYFTQISGRGRAMRGEVEVVVAPDRYKTGKRYVPEYGGRTMVTIVVSDQMEKPIIDDILSSISTGEASDGKIFVKDVIAAYDIGTKVSGEKAAL